MVFIVRSYSCLRFVMLNKSDKCIYLCENIVHPCYVRVPLLVEVVDIFCTGPEDAISLGFREIPW